jgi:hypothetical protein
LINASGMTPKIRDPILRAVREAKVEQSAVQLCELALHFARSGDQDFRQTLYQWVQERRISSSPEIGESQLLRLDAESALLLVARLRGTDLATREWEWDDGAVVSEAIEELGESRVRALLDGSSEPEIRRFGLGWSDNGKPTTGPASLRQDYARRMQSISVTDVFNSLPNDETCYWLRGWGMHTDESALNAILQRLWIEQEPAVLNKLLRVFSNRALPHFDSRLIDLVDHSDEGVCRRALKALKLNAHPMVRAFALDRLQRGSMGWAVAGLLARNFEAGDEQRLLDQIELPDDQVERHSMLMDLIEILELNESADSTMLGQIIYFNTPCQNCRFDAVRLLVGSDVVPTWLVQEGRSDANESCRALLSTECAEFEANDEP